MPPRMAEANQTGTPPATVRQVVAPWRDGTDASHFLAASDVGGSGRSAPAFPDALSQWQSRGGCRLALALAAWIAFSSSQVAASTYWWDTTTTNAWSTAGNWWTTACGSTTGGPPGSSDTAVFNGTGVNGATIVQLSGNTSVSGVTFGNTALRPFSPVRPRVKP